MNRGEGCVGNPATMSPLGGSEEEGEALDL